MAKLTYSMMISLDGYINDTYGSFDWGHIDEEVHRHANAAGFWYIDRLPGEPMDGTADLHVHPLEPLAVRLTLSKTF